MKNRFFCPKCKGSLNIGEHIVFTIVNKKNQKGIALLSPMVGDYSVTISDDFKVAEGEFTSFCCPLCDSKLQAPDLNENLARIGMVDEMGVSQQIVFSQIAGEKCTYKIHENNVEAFGKDSAHYLYYFTLIRGH